MKPRVWMLLVPPLAALPRKKLPAMQTDTTKKRRQPKLEGCCVRGRETDFFRENESSVRLIED
jgi:hypothetical protein